jgi:hypothetical protein
MSEVHPNNDRASCDGCDHDASRGQCATPAYCITQILLQLCTELLPLRLVPLDVCDILIQNENRLAAAILITILGKLLALLGSLPFCCTKRERSSCCSFIELLSIVRRSNLVFQLTVLLLANHERFFSQHQRLSPARRSITRYHDTTSLIEELTS